jgi:hypothetical protein
MRMSSITSIDNGLGINLQASGDDFEKSLTVLKDSAIYGETDAEDCPENHDCYCHKKFGFSLFGGNHAGKPPHITMPSAVPMHKIKSYGNWAADTYIKSVSFNNFDSSTTKCWAK